MGLSGSQFDSYLQAGTGDRGIISDFHSWLQGLQSHHYQYVVATTRRASNLIALVREEYPDTLPSYITENGLLLLAEEAAKSYKETGTFPKIAVVDDVLVYGRNVNLLLSQFWSTIRQCLSRLDIDPEAEGAEATFLQSVNLWIYAVNEAPILLRHEFQLTMHSQQLLAENQWRSLSDSIARRIAVEDVANTSYVISVKLPCNLARYQPDPASWIADKGLRYRNNHQQYTFYLFSPAAMLGIYPSVRSYKKRDFLYFTPYFFMRKLSWPQAIRVLTAIFDISFQEDPEATNECIHLLNRIIKCSSRMTVYAQFVILLLSQITLSTFLEHLKLAPNQVPKLIYDTDKIVHNFGLPEGSGSILQRFCRIKWNSFQLIKLLDCLKPADVLLDTPPARGVGRAAIVNIVERLTYQQAVAHERDAAERLLDDLAEAPANPLVNQTGEQDLGRFLDRVKAQAGGASDVKSMLFILSCLTQMMDLGDISLKARSRNRNGSPVFYSSVRTTEMSLAIMPRKLSGYYQHFYLLARLYWRDGDFPERVERYFRNVIFAGDPDPRNEATISDARFFAQLIAENRIIAGSMLNWGVPLETEA